VFEHLHKLELQYHLNRSTGAVSRVIDRGSRYVIIIENKITLPPCPAVLSSRRNECW
jgi:ABC-type transport system involved in Fe-S cluster assembly fused permease/ATPase subunit